MEIGVSEARRSISRSRGLTRAVTMVTVGLLIAAGVAIWLLRQGAIADTEDDNHRLGVVLAEQTARTLQSVDVVLQEVSDKLATGRVADLKSLHDVFGGPDFHAALAKRLIDLPQAEGFAIVDSTGHFVVASWQWPAPDYSLADQDYFRHFANAPDRNPYISDPDISGPGIGLPSGVPTVSLVRRLTAPDGTFLGVVVSPILLGYFDAFFARTGLGDGTGVTILRHDGTALVHFPAGVVSPGTRVPANLAWYETVAAGGGQYRSPGGFANAGPSFVSVHPLALYPIVVDVTRSEAAALARWWREATAIGIGVLAATVGLTLLLQALDNQITLIEESQLRIAEQVGTIQASEARLGAQSALLETTLEHMNQGLLMIDGAGTIAVYNRRFMEIFDLPADLLEIHPRATEVIEFLTKRGEWVDPQGVQFDMSLVLNNQAKYERRRPNGTVLEVYTAPLADGGLVRTYTDITARTTAEAMLGVAASHDQLTGLANRNGFDLQLDAAVAAAQRGNTQLAVLGLDLDRFKAVNDTLGHNAGDQLLILVAQRMREIARSTDIVGRLGGDEFAVVLPGANRAGAELASQRLLASIGLPYILGGESARIGVSIGITVYPTDGATAEQLLRNADAALYMAKAKGRNRWCAYASEDGQRERQRILLEQDFRAAVELQQFTLFYQPICDGATSEPVGFEALLRWNHASRGAVSPAEFIPLAEQTGLIVPLGRWAIEVACAEAAAWAIPLDIAVNLSPAQFRDHDLVACIEAVLSRTGLSPTRLALEVTEGLLLVDVEAVVKTMQTLRAMGIRMVLDDFGTANSNLGYLRGFPFDMVKIDRSFLRALNSDPRARALVEAILTMARALGLEVVGEGVETQEQLALLCHLQCRWVQGYLLGRPAPSEETRDRIWQLAGGNTRQEKSGRVPRAVTLA
jgi:diguanylate cyclase (GGDEF)-like protein